MFLDRKRITDKDILCKHVLVPLSYGALIKLVSTFKKDKSVPANNYFKKNKRIWEQHNLTQATEENRNFIFEVLKTVLIEGSGVSDDSPFFLKIENAVLSEIGCSVSKEKTTPFQGSKEDIFKTIKDNTKYTEIMKNTLLYCFGYNDLNDEEKEQLGQETLVVVNDANVPSKKEEVLFPKINPTAKRSVPRNNIKEEEQKTVSESEYKKLIGKYNALMKKHEGLLNKIQSAINNITSITNSNQFDITKNHKSEINPLIAKIKKEADKGNWKTVKESLLDLYLYVDIISEGK
jgi:hypothetical protein